ncbi:RNA methyltransferase [Clostridia bacterium]|nr:RNA methyltransferase [Clostridia bacterium]
MKCKTRRGRDKQGLFILEGEKPIREALLAGIAPVVLYVRENSPVIEELPGLLGEKQETVRILETNMFDALCETVTSQDLFFAGRIPKHDMKEYAGTGDLLIIDQVQDPGNLGTILRTSVAAGILDIVLTKGTVDLYNPKVLRSSAGGFFKCRIYYSNEYSVLLDRLQELGVEVVCADVDGTVDLFSLKKEGPQALIVGNEGNGPDRALINGAGQLVRIPMPGGSESLNVSVAAALLVYESVRKRKTD